MSLHKKDMDRTFCTDRRTEGRTDRQGDSPQTSFAGGGYKNKIQKIEFQFKPCQMLFKTWKGESQYYNMMNFR